MSRETREDRWIGQPLPTLDEVVTWFRSSGQAAPDGWTPLEAFVEAWKHRLTPRRGLSDLKLLVRQGRLERRMVDPPPGVARAWGRGDGKIAHFRVPPATLGDRQ